MLCKDPYTVGGMLYGCGQCTPCRHNRRRIWAHRISLEASQWAMNCFMTLTYDDKHLPEDGSLEPTHLTKFIKRLRHHYDDTPLRYFAVGEYGDESNRPHYHAVVFNLHTCQRGQSRYTRKDDKCCQVCSAVKMIWGYGNVYLGTVTPSTAQYVAGYVVKKMTHREDLRLNGRHPEFARMSLKPGIGASAMVDVASDILSVRSVTSDISSLGYGKKSKPLGRYLTRKLRQYRGLDEGAPQEVLDKVQSEVLGLRLAARESKEVPSVKGQYQIASASKIAGFEARSKIFRQRRKI